MASRYFSIDYRKVVGVESRRLSYQYALYEAAGCDMALTLGHLEDGNKAGKQKNEEKMQKMQKCEETVRKGGCSLFRITRCEWGLTRCSLAPKATER